MNQQTPMYKWKHFKAFLDNLLELPLSPEQKLIHLEQHCEGKPALFNELKVLLAEMQPEATPQPPPYASKPLILSDIGVQIGAYRLCEELGRGGAGIVYRAERVKGDFEQEVAIKILHDRHYSLERFQREQQLLAALSHPNIAQLYDGGVTENGEPYFVMEYIQGEAIHHYCDRNNLSINERLQLILQVIDALAFSHKNLIIHRDVKPSNIFVTQHGQVKLLDFGIAKFIDHDASMQLTRTGEQVLTPGFASPEQLQGKPVSLATDIYQLGLVAYELLTGKKAYRDQVENFWQISTLMRDQLPTKPSVVVTRLVTPVQIENAEKNLLIIGNNTLIPSEEREKYNEIFSVLRCTTVQKLKKQLQGDLDVFLLKMLRNEPEQRYSSMEAVKADLEAYFESRPLLAQQKKWHYYSRKFFLRNWKAISVALSFVVLLLSYAGSVTWQSTQIALALQQSQQDALKAQHVSDFLTNIFESAASNLQTLEDISAKQLLDEAESRISDELSDIPEVKADMLSLLSGIYSHHAEFDRSISLIQESVELLRELGDEYKFTLANNLRWLAADFSFTERDVKQAFSFLDESLAIYRKSTEPLTIKQSLDYSSALQRYGVMLFTQGELHESNQYLLQALRIFSQYDIAQYDFSYTQILMNTHNVLGLNYKNLGHIKKSKYHFNQFFRISEEYVGIENYNYSVVLMNFCLMLTREEQFIEAERNLNKVISLQKRILGEEHYNYAQSLKALGVIFYQQGDFLKAEELFLEAFAVEKLSVDKNSRFVVTTHPI